MKKIKYLPVVIVMMIGIAGYSQVRNKEEMVKRIFEVLKNKDEEGFIKLFPDAATLKSFAAKFLDADTSLKDRDKIKASLNEITDSSLRVELHKSFIKFLKRGELYGVDWSHALFTSYKADSSMVKQGAITAPTLTGSIYFTIDKKEYFLEFKDVTWIENKGWYGAEIVHADAKSSEINRQKNGPIVKMDSVIIR